MAKATAKTATTKTEKTIKAPVAANPAPVKDITGSETETDPAKKDAAEKPAAPAKESTKDASPAKGKKENFVSLLDAAMEDYKKAYPDEKKFYISTDGQVFLEKNKGDAAAHQAFLKAGTEPAEYIV